ncbi:SHOCT domain-containing protein [Rubrobacter aplysinae]|uniref:hypothetical protein n=1 Tax=Rubrobacter aplysinae TaxID=909625 RepID=UPI00064C0873|nr:hypothetical protein [Rubrobacter aplysinae]
MLESLFFWELLTFVVLMGVLFIFYPVIQRRKRRIRRLMEDSGRRPPAPEELDSRYAEGEVLQEEYLEAREDITKMTEDQNAR